MNFGEHSLIPEDMGISTINTSVENSPRKDAFSKSLNFAQTQRMMRHPYLLSSDRRYQQQLRRKVAKPSPESPRKQAIEAQPPKRQKEQITSLDSFQLLKNKDLELIMKLTKFNNVMQHDKMQYIQRSVLNVGSGANSPTKNKKVTSMNVDIADTM